MVRLFDLVIVFAAVVFSSPVPSRPEWKNVHEMNKLENCRTHSNKEDFELYHRYYNAPHAGPSIYQRFGIGYLNLIRVDVPRTFGKTMLDKGTTGAAAVCGTIGSNAICHGDNVGILTLRPRSHVHAFRVDSLDYFCTKDYKPTPCSLLFVYSKAKENSRNNITWETIDMNYEHSTSGYYEGGSWGSPKGQITFGQAPPMKAFAIYPIPGKLDMKSNGTFPNEDLFKTIYASDITAYVDNVRFTTWECAYPLSDRPLNGRIKALIEGPSDGKGTWEDNPEMEIEDYDY